MLDEINDIIEQFENELTLITQQVMISHGVDKNSKLINSVGYEYNSETNVFQLLAFDYYTWVSTGRQPRARKVPILPLVQWIKDKKIQGRNKKTGRFISNNSLAFAIQNSIYKTGIKGKNYIQAVEDAAGNFLEFQLADTLEFALLQELDKTFRNN